MKKVENINHFLPMPFWSWNDLLLPDKTESQMLRMAEQNIGGVVIHSRGGLQTPYMQEDWYRNIDRSISCAESKQMEVWIYDEDGWPSGFAGGLITDMGDDYRQKWLCMEEADNDVPNTICHVGKYRFSFEVNPYYIDVLEPRACKEFIERIYVKYADKYGQRIQGFFNDEPQVSRYRFPWSHVLPDAYRAAYGDDLLPRLPELFLEIGEWKTTRVRFWKLVSDLFSQNFLKPLHDFCASRSLKLTGHLLSEESLSSQIYSSGSVMPQYEYFDMPGMDWLGRSIKDCLTPMQVSSVAQQLGKEQVLSETFAGCGHNFTFDEMKELYEWQMVHGITRLCPHLSSYSLRGLRKRDHPPALSEQQPWWEYYGVFNRSVSNISRILSTGKVQFDVLLIHPQTTAWSLFNGSETKELHELNNRLLAEMRLLEEKHICYHLGDETVMGRHGSVKGNTLQIGTQCYSKIILLPGCCLLDSTKTLLDEYRKGGGCFTSANDLPANPVIDNPKITFTQRQTEEGTVFYFVNSSGEPQDAVIPSGGKQLDEQTGEWKPFCGAHSFPKGGSLMVLDDGTPQISPLPKRKFRLSPIAESQPVWKIKHPPENCFTMDICTYWFDGVLMEESGYVLDVMQKALELERPVHIRMQFRFAIDSLPQKCWLLAETPEFYQLTCNGLAVPQTDCGFFADEAFRKRDLTGLLQIGDNVLEAETDFRQSPEVYRKVKQAYAFEVEKNRFKCDMEIEPFYLLGDFGVYTSDEWSDVVSPPVKDAFLVSGGFRLGKIPEQVFPAHLERQGFPFFAGKLTLETKLNVTAGSLSEKRYLSFQKSGCHAVVITVNGKQLSPILWEPFSVDLSPYLREGENDLQITTVGNLRNMLGPHHAGTEPVLVRPGYFQRSSSFWAQKPIWDARYCLVHFGIHSICIKEVE